MKIFLLILFTISTSSVFAQDQNLSSYNNLLKATQRVRNYNKVSEKRSIAEQGVVGSITLREKYFSGVSEVFKLSYHGHAVFCDYLVRVSSSGNAEIITFDCGE